MNEIPTKEQIEKAKSWADAMYAYRMKGSENMTGVDGVMAGILVAALRDAEDRYKACHESHVNTNRDLTVCREVANAERKKFEARLKRLEKALLSISKPSLTKDEFCRKHKPKNKIMGYTEHALWMEKMHKMGFRQRQCPKCKRWLYGCEE